MLTQQTTNTWRNLAHPSDVSPSRCRRSVFFSKQQRTRIFGCVIHGMLRQKWSDESLFPIYTLGGEKHCKMASVRDVQHELDPRNVGEPKTIKIKQRSFETQPVLWELTRLKWRWTFSWLKAKHLHIIHRMTVISSQYQHIEHIDESTMKGQPIFSHPMEMFLPKASIQD